MSELFQYYSSLKNGWEAVGGNSDTKIEAYALSEGEIGYVAGGSVMLNTIVRARFRTQGNVLDLKSNMSHPQCKIRWDPSFQGHHFHHILDNNTLYATAFLRGFRPIISNRSFHGVLEFHNSITKCITLAYSAVPYDEVALALDQQEGRVPSYIKLASFKVEQHTDGVEIQLLVQADPINVPQYLLLPLISRIIPAQMASLVKFSKEHGGSPMIYKMDGDLRKSVRNIEYSVEAQEVCLQFYQSSGKVQFEFRIDDKFWLYRLENSPMMYFQSTLCTLHIITEFRDDNWFVKLNVSEIKVDASVQFRAYSYGNFEDVQVVTLAHQILPLFASPQVSKQQLGNLQSMASVKFQEFEQYYGQMIGSPVIDIINGTKVYKKQVSGHPIGLVLGVAEHPGNLKAYDLGQVIVSAGCRKIWDDIFDSAVVLDRPNSKSKIVHSKTKAVWPTVARDIVACVCELEMSKDRVVIVAFTLPDQFVPQELRISKTVRAQLDLAVWYIENTNGRLWVKYMVLTHPGGSIPRFLLERVGTSFPSCIDRTVKYLNEHGCPPHIVGDQSQILFSQYDNYKQEFRGQANGQYQVLIDVDRWLGTNWIDVSATTCVYDDAGTLTLTGMCIIQLKQTPSISKIVFNGLPLQSLLDQSQESIYVKEKLPILEINNSDEIIVAHAAYRQVIDVLEFQLWKRVLHNSKYVKVYQSQDYYRFSTFAPDNLDAVIFDQEVRWNTDVVKVSKTQLMPETYRIEKLYRDGSKETVIQYRKETKNKNLPTLRVAQQSQYFSAWLITQHQSLYKIQYIVEAQQFNQGLIDRMEQLLTYRDDDIQVEDWPHVQRDYFWQTVLFGFLLGLIFMYIIK